MQWGIDSGNDFCRFSDIRKEKNSFLVVPKKNDQEWRSSSLVCADGRLNTNFHIFVPSQS